MNGQEGDGYPSAPFPSNRPVEMEEKRNASFRGTGTRQWTCLPIPGREALILATLLYRKTYGNAANRPYAFGGPNLMAIIIEFSDFIRFMRTVTRRF